VLLSILLCVLRTSSIDHAVKLDVSPVLLVPMAAKIVHPRQVLGLSVIALSPDSADKIAVPLPMGGCRTPYI